MSLRYAWLIQPLVLYTIVLSYFNRDFDNGITVIFEYLVPFEVKLMVPLMLPVFSVSFSTQVSPLAFGERYPPPVNL